MTDDKKAVSITVPSKDPKKKDGDKDGGDGDKEVTTLDGVGGGGAADGGPKKKTKGGKDSILEPEELSDEDKALKEGLELAVTRVDDTEPGIGESCRHFLAASASCFASFPGFRSCCSFRVEREHRASEAPSHAPSGAASDPVLLSLVSVCLSLSPPLYCGIFVCALFSGRRKLDSKAGPILRNRRNTGSPLFFRLLRVSLFPPRFTLFLFVNSPIPPPLLRFFCLYPTLHHIPLPWWAACGACYEQCVTLSGTSLRRSGRLPRA